MSDQRHAGGSSNGERARPIRHFTENTEDWFEHGEGLAARAAAGESVEALEGEYSQTAWWRASYRARVAFVTGSVLVTTFAIVWLL